MEFLTQGVETTEKYPYSCSESFSNLTIDWEPIVLSIIEDLTRNIRIKEISARFHNTFAEIILTIAQRFGERRMVLSGGCFQNAYLIEKTIMILRSNGFYPYWHQRVPTNDGGLSLGQSFIALSRKQRRQTVENKSQQLSAILL